MKLKHAIDIFLIVGFGYIICALHRDFNRLSDNLQRTRNAIRKHRDQQLDDRCWMDDYALYEVLPEGLAGADCRGLPYSEMITNCNQYLICRLNQLTPEQALVEYQLWKITNGRL